MRRHLLAALLLACSLPACAELDDLDPSGAASRRPNVGLPTVRVPTLPPIATLPPVRPPTGAVRSLLPTRPTARPTTPKPRPTTARPSARPTSPPPATRSATPARTTGSGDRGSDNRIETRNSAGSWDWPDFGFGSFLEGFAALLAGFVCAMFALVAMIGFSLVAMTFAFAAVVIAGTFAAVFGPVAGFGALLVAIVLLGAVALRRRGT